MPFESRRVCASRSHRDFSSRSAFPLNDTVPPVVSESVPIPAPTDRSSNVSAGFASQLKTLKRDPEVCFYDRTWSLRTNRGRGNVFSRLSSFSTTEMEMERNNLSTWWKLCAGKLIRACPGNLLIVPAPPPLPRKHRQNAVLLLINNLTQTADRREEENAHRVPRVSIW